MLKRIFLDEFIVGQIIIFFVLLNFLVIICGCNESLIPTSQCSNRVKNRTPLIRFDINKAGQRIETLKMPEYHQTKG